MKRSLLAHNHYSTDLCQNSINLVRLKPIRRLIQPWLLYLTVQLFALQCELKPHEKLQYIRGLDIQKVQQFLYEPNR